MSEEKNAVVKTAFTKVEALLPGKFFGGDEVGYADLLAFPFFERHYWVATLGVGPLDGQSFPGKDYPKLTAYFKNVSEIPEVYLSYDFLINKIISDQGNPPGARGCPGILQDIHQRHPGLRRRPLIPCPIFTEKRVPIHFIHTLL